MVGDDERSGEFLRLKSQPTASASAAPSVLVAEDNPDLQWRLARTLTIDGCRVVGTSSVAGALALLEQWSVDVALIGERVCTETGPELLIGRLRRLRPDLPVIVIASASRHSEQAVVPQGKGPDSAFAPVILRPPIQPENVRAALHRARQQQHEALGLLTATPAG